MDWDGIRVFLAVQRTGRVSAAARQLGVEHTTVSRRLAALEEELGVALFYRTAAGYRLTPHGQSALSSAEAMERSALAIGARARQDSDEVHGRVRVALLEELASHWLAPNLPAFRARYPAIDLQVLVGIKPLDLGRGEAELAVRTPRPRQAGLAAARLGRSATALYVHESLLGGKRASVKDPASLNGLGLPLLAYLPEFQLVQSAPWFRSTLDSARVVLASNDTRVLLASARAALGVAVLPCLVARDAPELVRVSEDVGGSEFWLVTHPEYRRDPKVRATADFLKRIASQIG